ncbi:hypothetical protein [Nocardioides sp. TF02-7]|uniref:hypothetical protein n=1 Tax=Nocardioides sp. TF02-7 TaxID=2917724 RepID=UPI001F067A08|nr:hypothetical protein [Nocardioides sp. TF02-7]UMG92454.1 hypothetical protein MF408_21825 [Nocardioides sp. TF02-7]
MLLVAGMLAVAVVPSAPPPATASCAGPSLEGVERLVLQPGASFTVEGVSFVDGCQDSMGCGVGCGACEHDEPPPTPMADVRLQLVQRDRTWDLGVADAGTAGDELGRVTWTFRVPEGARPGRARLVADGMEPVPIRVR